MSKLVAEEEQLRAEADDLLWDRGLHSLLEDYGQVRTVGSYALRLMTWRDLDTLAEYCTRPGYRRDFTSRDIYRAVLDQGVRNPDQFQAYLDMGRQS